MRAIIIVGDAAALCKALKAFKPEPKPDLESMKEQMNLLAKSVDKQSYKTSDVELPNGRIESPRWRKGRNTALNRIIQ